MRFSFWRSRDRFSLDELRYLVEQLMKVQIVNEANKGFVIESLRSIAELITYGDQHDAAYFEYFMEYQVMGEFVRILRISQTVTVSLQLLQTMSIMIQNLKNERSIHYMLSNEHVACLITFSFVFQNEELLSYYVSFLRAISGKLNKNVMSLLVTTQNDEVDSFPLYVEAIRFAFHEESMIRTAVRTLTLNVYHVGHEAVNKFVSTSPRADYFLNLVKFFRDQCSNLNLKVSSALKNLSQRPAYSVLSTVDEIEDNLYYLNDIVSAGIPDVGRLILDNILSLLILPLLLPSLRIGAEPDIGAVTSLYLLSCILRILKVKDLANTVAAALLCRTETFAPNSEAMSNESTLLNGRAGVVSQNSEENDQSSESDAGSLQVIVPISSSSESQPPNGVSGHGFGCTQFFPRDALLSFVTSGDDVQVFGSLNLLATVLQTKELAETMVDALGILPRRKQHKKKLLTALVGEDSGEEQLFSSESSEVGDATSNVLDVYLQKLKDYYGVSCARPEVGSSPCLQRFQVLDALVSLFCRSNISAEALWDGGWLLRQLIPYSNADLRSHHRRLLKDSFHNCSNRLLEETKGTWTDHLITVFGDEWRKCKKVIEAASHQKDPKALLLPPQKSMLEELTSSESSFTDGERMHETVKVFVLLHHLFIFSLGGVVLDHPSVVTAVDIPKKSRAKNAGIDPPGPKPDTDVINLVDTVPCRIAFEPGKERHYHFLPVSVGRSGWLVLAEELLKQPQEGIIRALAPLAGCNPRIDDKHPKWLHLRIRPSSFNAVNYTTAGKVNAETLVDGRWTLAFSDEEACKYALSMTLDEVKIQSYEVERSLKPLLELDTER